MNVNVMSKRICCVLFLLFNCYTLCYPIIHSSSRHLRNGWGLRPANHFYQCNGLKTSGSRFSLEVESVVSYASLFETWSNLIINYNGIFKFLVCTQRITYTCLILGPHSFNTANATETKKEVFGMVLYNESIYLAN